MHACKYALSKHSDIHIYIYIFFFFNEKSCRVAYGLKKNENKRYVELTLSQQKKQQLKTDKYMTAIPVCAVNQSSVCTLNDN